MKIEITPQIIEAFNEEGKPALVTIGIKGIMFSKIAEKLLALKPGNSFLLEFEDGSLFYKESVNGFKLTQTGKYQVLTSNATNVGKYIDRFFKKGVKNFRFEIGEFKEGRRKLTMVE